MQVNQDEVQQMSVSGQSTVGAYFVVEGYQIPVVLSASEVSTLLASYSPSSSSSRPRSDSSGSVIWGRTSGPPAARHSVS